jgi:myo-inositol-1(or 4)-monophosphatase
LTRAARLAGTIQRRGLRRAIVHRKGIGDLVTDVDLACERAVTRLIGKRHPEHGILAEEGTGDVAGDDFLWILDPLDGTKNFAHGYTRFCVSLALALRGEVVLGAVYDPSADELFMAQLGDGATLNGKEIGVSAVRELDSALIASSLTNRSRPDPEQLKRVAALIPRVQGLRIDGCAALDLCDVACGRLDGFVENGLAAWDTAAGALMVREAGGEISDLAGNPSTLGALETIASNGTIHRELLSLVRLGQADP